MDLNREVAEKVMGINWRERPGWNPLKDLNQCFEVVEKLKSTHGFWIGYDPRKEKWRGQFFLKGTCICFEEISETPNEAILKAALAATD